MKRINLYKCFAGALAIGTIAVLAAGPAQAATYSSSAQFASWTDGTYTVYNDEWGAHYTYQGLWVNSHSNWGVWSQQDYTSGVEAYPNVSRTINRSISSLSSVSSAYTVTDPSAGSYEAAYDIWTEDNANEIMIWTDVHNVGPLGSNVGSLTLDGRTYHVYKGTNGSNNVFSFVDTSTVTSGTFNILDILKWIQNTKGWMSNETLGKVQFGWEITTENPGQNFQVDSYSVSFS
jgi:Glycosyl hydrolase family 12